MGWKETDLAFRVRKEIGLTVSEKMVLVYLAHRYKSDDPEAEDRDDKHRFAYPSLQLIAHDTGLHKVTVSKAIHKLKEEKIIKVGQTKGGRNKYWVTISEDKCRPKKQGGISLTLTGGKPEAKGGLASDYLEYIEEYIEEKEEKESTPPGLDNFPEDPLEEKRVEESSVIYGVPDKIVSDSTHHPVIWQEKLIPEQLEQIKKSYPAPFPVSVQLKADVIKLHEESSKMNQPSDETEEEFDMVGVIENAKKAKEKYEKSTPGTELGRAIKAWRTVMLQEHPGLAPFPKLTQKEVGFMKAVIKRTQPDPSKTITAVVSEWHGFKAYVEDGLGQKIIGTLPKLGILAKYADEARIWYNSQQQPADKKKSSTDTGGSTLFDPKGGNW